VGDVRRIAGRVVVAGRAQGEALVTDVPLSFWGGVDPATGEIIDRRHPLSGACLTSRILVLPHGRGSCSASGVLLEAIRNATAPAAILVTRLDPIIGLGAILGDELYARPLPLLVIAPADAASVRTGDRLDVGDDGIVEVRSLTA
jgi:predicted aconitase with swiveling domain